ncbi:hypothetical protein BDF14DRAFT_1886091 [Spinellus fusiger]|nr:hypothetical protein BDF14DRAFT_1886091 [Spinellus fusiger]
MTHLVEALLNVKQEPLSIFPEEDVMNYLNAEYLSTDLYDHASPLSDMASSSCDTELTFNDIKLDELPFDPSLPDPLLDSGYPWTTLSSDGITDPRLQSDFFAGLPFLFPQVSSHPVSPSSTCSSDSEQPKKKRGRKKRLATTPLPPPLAIAPAPVKPTVTRLLPCTPTAPIKQEAVGSQDIQKAAAQAKRQDRLIKNRAAALLSRKRKREHMNTLEEQNKALEEENALLKTQVSQLTQKVGILEKENEAIRRRTVSHSMGPTPKATGMVFMILFFSFALFSFPSHSGRLTVGGSGKSMPLLGLASTPSNTTDLVLMEPVRLHEAETWALQTRTADVVGWPTHQHVYLYADRLSRMGPNVPLSQSPVLSLLSPVESNDRYLQIDVKVLGSRIVQGQLDALIHCSATEEMNYELWDKNTTRPRTKRNLRRQQVRTSRVLE